MDPFVVLGVPAVMDLDADELERRYLELSRQSHPDHHGDASTQEQIALLARSARINDAYRALRDPWSRARALVEMSQPGVLERSKQLCPTFLMEAMEMAEAAAHADPDRAAALRDKLAAQVQRYLDKISAQIAQRAWGQAATSLHESRYYRKTLQDLEARS